MYRIPWNFYFRMALKVRRCSQCAASCFCEKGRSVRGKENESRIITYFWLILSWTPRLMSHLAIWARPPSRRWSDGGGLLDWHACSCSIARCCRVGTNGALRIITCGAEHFEGLELGYICLHTVFSQFVEEYCWQKKGKAYGAERQKKKENK